MSPRPFDVSPPGRGRTRGLSGQVLNALLGVVRWGMTSEPFLYIVLCLLVGASLAASLQTGAWHWFQRSGALAVAVGAILSTQRPLTAMLDGKVDHPRERRPRGDGDARRGEFAELRTCVCGFVLVAMGTIIWAYGDLLGCLLNWNAACLA